MSGETRGNLRRGLLTSALVVIATAGYLTVVALRHGPPPGGDTTPVTEVTTELSHGDLQAAASITSIPNPPGFALLASPLVVAFRWLVGSPSWCDMRPPPQPNGVALAARQPALVAAPACGSSEPAASEAAPSHFPPWYRAQGVLGVLAWPLLAAGCLALLRAAGVDTLGHRLGMVAFLVVLPSASSAIVQLYHPQDIASLGLATLAMAMALRNRYGWAGATFGLAVLTKQFALLVMIPAFAGAPSRLARTRLVAGAVVIFGAGILPFVIASPHATLDNLTGFGRGGALSGPTVLTLLGGTGSTASAVSRDAPVLFSIAICWWAARRFGPSLARPELITALALACLGSRLVFESVVFPYYLLATSVFFVVHDLVARRSPARSIGWCAVAAFFAAIHPSGQVLEATGTAVLAFAAVGAGIFDLVRGAGGRQVVAGPLPM